MEAAGRTAAILALCCVLLLAPVATCQDNGAVREINSLRDRLLQTPQHLQEDVELRLASKLINLERQRRDGASMLEAESLLLSVASRARARGDSDRELETLSLMASVFVELGREREARATANRTLAICEGLGEPLSQGSCLSAAFSHAVLDLQAGAGEQTGPLALDNLFLAGAASDAPELYTRLSIMIPKLSPRTRLLVLRDAAMIARDREGAIAYAAFLQREGDGVQEAFEALRESEKAEAHQAESGRAGEKGPEANDDGDSGGARSIGGAADAASNDATCPDGAAAANASAACRARANVAAAAGAGSGSSPPSSRSSSFTTAPPATTRHLFSFGWPSPSDAYATAALERHRRFVGSVSNADAGWMLFAVGKDAARRGDHRRAFAAWTAANALQIATSGYDRTLLQRRYDTITKYFSPEAVAASPLHELLNRPKGAVRGIEIGGGVRVLVGDAAERPNAAAADDDDDRDANEDTDESPDARSARRLAEAGGVEEAGAATGEAENGAIAEGSEWTVSLEPDEASGAAPAGGAADSAAGHAAPRLPARARVVDHAVERVAERIADAVSARFGGFDGVLGGRAKGPVALPAQASGSPASFAPTPPRLPPRPLVARSAFRPVFIVGMPRSGSTLLEQMLSSHPSVWGAGEDTPLAPLIPPMLDQLEANGFDPGIAQRAGARYLAETMRRIPRDKSFATHVVDKMLGHVWNVGFVKAMLPDACILHAVRHPADVALSCLAQPFNGRGLGWAHSMPSIAEATSRTLAMARHWDTALPGALTRVRYERLVLDPQAELAPALEACGIDWHPNMLNFYKLERRVLTASLAQVRRPLYTNSIGKWKHYAKRDELGALLKQLKTEILDYERETGLPSSEELIEAL